MANVEKRNNGGNTRIAIIGTGNVGRALARALQRARHTIVFGTRSPDPSDADQATIAEAVANAEATILAVPFGGGPGRDCRGRRLCRQGPDRRHQPTRYGFARFAADDRLFNVRCRNDCGHGAGRKAVQSLQPDGVREHGRRHRLCDAPGQVCCRGRCRRETASNGAGHTPDSNLWTQAIWPNPSSWRPTRCSG